MLWWHWMLFGLGLLVIEMLTPGGIVALFFGLAAVMLGMLVGLEVAGPPWVQWCGFAGLSLVSLLLFRGPLLTRLSVYEPATPRMDTLVGEMATLLEDVPPGAVGKAELRGTAWNVQHEQTGSLRKGQRCRVLRVSGLTLWVEAAEHQGETA